MAEWRKALLKRLGAPITHQNLSFLSGWQRWEGGHTNNNARYNWLNTTHGPGTSINKVGVKSFDSFDTGIKSMAETLHNGYYGDILDALASGDPYSARPERGLQTWVAGPKGSNPGYVRKVLGSYSGGAAPKRPVPGMKGRRQEVQGFDADGALAQVLFDDDPEFLDFLSTIPDEHVQKAGIVSKHGSVRPVDAENDVIAAAQTQLGKPYVFGSGPSTDSFDCSDLIQWAYGQVGIHIPRTTYEQMKVLPKVPWKSLSPGDLLYKDNGGHVVMYVGNGKVIAAPYTGTVVQHQPLSKFKSGYHVRRVPRGG